MNFPNFTMTDKQVREEAKELIAELIRACPDFNLNGTYTSLFKRSLFKVQACLCVYDSEVYDPEHDSAIDAVLDFFKKHGWTILGTDGNEGNEVGAYATKFGSYIHIGEVVKHPRYGYRDFTITCMRYAPFLSNLA